MPKITKIEIQKRNKDKANLFLDDEFRCGLTAESVVRARLIVGDELTEERLDEIFLTSESEIAFNKACDYISRSMKTVKQIRDWLKGKSFDSKVIENVIGKLREYRYIDDSLYAELYINSNLQTKGKRRLAVELTQKGINKDLIEKTVDALPNDKLSENANILAEKYMRNKDNSTQNLIKLQRYLLSRGYDYDIVNEIIKNFAND
ncbi:MAG TPA: RecX family transcriptional regulator [Eubacteriales bacterium]|nr:RecX family transcriptional regulator [Eubacteriales bacterium]